MSRGLKSKSLFVFVSQAATFTRRSAAQEEMKTCRCLRRCFHYEEIKRRAGVGLNYNLAFLCPDALRRLFLSERSDSITSRPVEKGGRARAGVNLELQMNNSSVQPIV